MHKEEEMFQTHLQRKSAQSAPTMLNEMCKVSDSKVHMPSLPNHLDRSKIFSTGIESSLHSWLAMTEFSSAVLMLLSSMHDRAVVFCAFAIIHAHIVVLCAHDALFPALADFQSCVSHSS